MSSIIVAGDTSGSVTLAAPAVSGTTTLTLPATTGTVVIGTAPSGTIVGTTDTQTLTNKTLTSPTITGATITVASTAAPAFSAYRATTNQSISNATTTKVQLNAEEFDTNSNFDSTTNYRFTPTVAGYYQMNGSVAFNVTTMNLCVLFIYKNGSAFKRGTYISATQSTDSVGVVSGLIYFNGTSDYAELYMYINATVGTPVLVAGSDVTRLDGVFVRSA